MHVRVYSPDNRFSMAVTRRTAPGVAPVTTRESAFYPRIAELTDSVSEVNGYWLATTSTASAPSASTGRAASGWP